MDFSKDSRPKKAIARSIAVQKHDGKVSECALFLPSKNCECIKEALKTGLVDKNTYIVAVEKNLSYLPSIVSFLSENFNDFEINAHCGSDILEKRTRIEEIEEMDIFDYPFDSGVYFFDYAFFDFCGQITDKMAIWMMDNFNEELFKIGAHICFTNEVAFRKNRLFERYDNLHNNGGIVDICSKLKISLENTDLSNGLSCSKKVEMYFANTYNEKDMFTIWAIHAALWQIKLEAIDFYHYADTIPMFFSHFKIKGFNSRKSGYGFEAMLFLNELLRELRWTENYQSRYWIRPSADELRAVKSPKMIEAGKKAAETRKKNNNHLKGREAALKAWETRRKNGN